MSDRSNLISKLLADRDFRASYIRSKLDVLIPSQIRGLRLSEGMSQTLLADLAGMKQARISAMETPGKTNFNLETLVRTAATLSVGLKVELVPFSEMLQWENKFSQDNFVVTKLNDDTAFLFPQEKQIAPRRKSARKRSRPMGMLGSYASQVGQYSLFPTHSSQNPATLPIENPPLPQPKSNLVQFPVPRGQQNYFESKTATGGLNESKRRYLEAIGD
jgi:transcriptional regulator with XRE-family HTH domain